MYTVYVCYNMELVQNIWGNKSMLWYVSRHTYTCFSLFLAVVLYSGKLSREKTFVNFAVLWLFAKKRKKFWGCGILWYSTSEQSTKVFSMKILCSTNSQKFSPFKNFQLYGMSVERSGGCLAPLTSFLSYSMVQRKMCTIYEVYTTVRQWDNLIIPSEYF